MPAEKVLQDIVQVAEALAEVGTACTVDAGETELVILGALLRVGQHRAGLGSLFEFLYPAVRVPFEGSLAVSLLDIVFRGTLLDAQDLVVISFLCHRLMLLQQPWHNGEPSR